MPSLLTLTTGLTLWLVLSPLTLAGQFQAGFSQLDISPQPNQAKVLVLEGQLKSVQQVQQPILAKAVYLTDGQNQIALISLDVIGLPQPNRHQQIVQQLRQRLKVDQLLLLTTHTHSGVLSASQDQHLIKRLSHLVTQAKANQQAVKIASGQTQFEQGYKRIINANGQAQMLWSNPQRQATESADLSLGVINLTTLDDQPYISLINYNVHPVITMNRQDVVVSPDYPGRIDHHLKQQYGSNSLFMLGAAGDINPYDAGIADMGVKPVQLSLDRADALGKIIADKLISMIKNQQGYHTHGQFKYQTIRHDIEFKGTAQLKQAFITQGIDINQLYSEINTLVLTPTVALATFSGEFFSDFAIELRQASPVKNTFFVGYANGSLGYVPTLKALQLGGYGAQKEQLFFAEDLGHQQIKRATDSINRLLRH